MKHCSSGFRTGVFPSYIVNNLLRRHAQTSRAGATCELGGKLGVLLRDLDLGAGGLGVGEGVDNLTLCASELGGALEVLECAWDVVLLKEELGHGGDGNIALGVDCSILAFGENIQ